MAQCPPVTLEMEKLPAINAYASKLGQVFLNVLRNAVEATDGVSGGRVSVRARAADDAVEIAIEDNGVGIPREVMPKMIQPFFTTKPNGTGLGLWISQGLMALHGGSMEVTSVAGSGTTVALRLPIVSNA
jgi:signal transduction histidine kinase